MRKTATAHFQTKLSQISSSICMLLHRRFSFHSHGWGSGVVLKTCLPVAFLQDALQQQLFGQGSLGRILVQAANDANKRPMLNGVGRGPVSRLHRNFSSCPCKAVERVARSCCVRQRCLSLGRNKAKGPGPQTY